MRHGKKFNHLGRQTGHRKAMLRNMASSLILHKRITTTVAKAKVLRQYVEPIITRSKEGSVASRRVAFSYLQQKEAVHELFTDVAGKVAERNGGYTRIIKLGTRLGDNAELAMIELVDYNELYTQSSEKGGKKKRRRRRGGKGKSGNADEQSVATTEAQAANESAGDGAEDTIVQEDTTASQDETSQENTDETSADENTSAEEDDENKK